MAKKYYAVKIGRKPGVYETWEACKEQTHGFAGALFKSFPTKEEASIFAGKVAGISDDNCPAAELPGALKLSEGPLAETDGEKQGDMGEAVAYVDGSFDGVSGCFSYGMVMFYEGREEHFNRKFDDAQLAQMRNVAGEIKGAEAAMQYCLDRKIRKVTIYHDYTGIAYWCTGEWKANKPGTIDYAQFYKKAAEQMEIRFEKVKGHAGDRYNEMADRLAKEALGLL